MKTWYRLLWLAAVAFLTAGVPGGAAFAGADLVKDPPQVQSPEQEVVRVEETLDAMGSTYAVAAYGADEFQLQAAIGKAFDETRRIDRFLSNYRQNSELSELNRSAAQRPVAVSEDLFELLKACRDYSRKGEGSFDITVGALMRVWGFYRGSGRLPSPEEVKGALANVGYQHVQLNEVDRTVRFARQGLELDPGGIGKGYAVERMVAILREEGVTSAMVSAGGSTLYAIGTPPGEPRGWQVSVRNPIDPEEAIEEFFLKDESMSTSGNYEKFFMADGKMYSHIMDPRTGYPAEGMLSVSVIAPRALDSEAWTKPVYIMGREWARKNAPKTFRIFTCEDKAKQACAWLQ
jgi:FAD:protein FMN transferase